MIPALLELRDIFYSGPYAYQSDITRIESLHSLLVQDVLGYSTCIIADKEDYLSLAEALPSKQS